MKTYLKTRTLSLAIAASITLHCCSPNDPNPTNPPSPPQQNCRVTKITAAGFDPYLLSYSADGKLKTITHGEFSSTLSYYPASIEREYTKNGVLTNKHIYFLNAQSEPDSIYYITYSPGLTQTTTHKYTYAGGKQASLTVFNYMGVQIYFSTYTWANGNKIKAQPSGESEGFYTYDAAHTFRDGDFNYLIYVLQGSFLLKNKDLITAISLGSVNQTFQYTFDNNGKITALNVTNSLGGNAPPVSTIYNYTYECF